MTSPSATGHDSKQFLRRFDDRAMKDGADAERPVRAHARHTRRIFSKSLNLMVLRERIELSTSPLPRECSTTELPQLISPADAVAACRARGFCHSETVMASASLPLEPANCRKSEREGLFAAPFPHRTARSCKEEATDPGQPSRPRRRKRRAGRPFARPSWRKSSGLPRPCAPICAAARRRSASARPGHERGRLGSSPDTASIAAFWPEAGKSAGIVAAARRARARRNGSHSHRRRQPAEWNHSDFRGQERGAAADDRLAADRSHGHARKPAAPRRRQPAGPHPVQSRRRLFHRRAPPGRRPRFRPDRPHDRARNRGHHRAL